MTPNETAKPTYTRATYYLALTVEKFVAAGLKGRCTPKRHPFDIIVDDVQAAIEVKTVIQTCKEQPLIRARYGARGRKSQYLAEKKLCGFTLAVDYRGQRPRYFLREGYGSYQLANMTPCTSLKHVRRHLVASYRQRVRESTQARG